MVCLYSHDIIIGQDLPHVDSEPLETSLLIALLDPSENQSDNLSATFGHGTQQEMITAKYQYFYDQKIEKDHQSKVQSVFS